MGKFWTAIKLHPKIPRFEVLFTTDGIATPSVYMERPAQKQLNFPKKEHWRRGLSA
jgi:hypothetical protein